MSEINLMITITKRALATKFLAFYQEHKVNTSLVTLGMGTANSEVLDYLGLENAEKTILFSFLTDTVWHAVKKELQIKQRIDLPGRGIAFTIPLSSISGKRELAFLLEGQDFKKEEESVMKNTTHELLLVIANQGYSDLVMDAARGCGAVGGTILHAKGTGMECAEKFLGVSLVAEKEMILILTKREIKNDIMRAIMQEAGLSSKAKSIIISLPVTSTAGLRLMEDEY